MEQPLPGVGVAADLATEPALTLQGGGGQVLVGWTTQTLEGSAELRIQALSPTGSPEWGAPGVRAAQWEYGLTSPHAVRGSDGWYLLWKQASLSGWEWDAQFITDSGSSAWTAPLTVAALYSDEYGGSARAASDGSLLFAYNDVFRRADSVFIGVSKVRREGALAWKQELGKDAKQAWYQLPALTEDGAGGVFLGYRHNDQSDKGIMVQRLGGGDGRPLWGHGAEVYDRVGYKGEPSMVSDGAGGVVVLWEDGRNGSLDIYAQRVSSGSSVLWEPLGKPVSVGPGNQWNPSAAADGQGGIYAVWIDDNRGSQWQLMMQHVDAKGDAALGPGGVPLAPCADQQSLPMAAPDSGGGATVCWIESRYAAFQILCQRRGPAGPLWGESDNIVVNSYAPLLGLQMIPDGSGGVVLAWKSKVEDHWDVQARRLGPDGHIVW